MSNVEYEINDDHPLALELSSLRTAVARFQHEAHTSALKLQRHSLEAALAIERAQALERENAAAHAELAVLRAHPDSTPRHAELQLPELTLALRRASDKRTLAEDALRARTAQFVDAHGAAERAQYAVQGAFGLAERARAREEEALARERALALRLRVVEEEGAMLDRAVGEYADLVRALERRQSLHSSPTPTPPPRQQRLQEEEELRSPPPPTPPPKESYANSANGQHREQDGTGASTLEALQEQHTVLHKLAGEFEGKSEALSDEISRLQSELEDARAESQAERRAAQEERVRLSNALTELELLQHDDNAAAKMVSRYMKFSQNTTDTLQKALEALAARHAATTSTLHTQLASAQGALATEQRQCARLRDVLDEATEQLARETYGRRREIALRLAVVGREDQLAEALRRWVRRAQETCAREDVPPARRLEAVVGDAGALLALVDGANAPSTSTSSWSDVGAVLDSGSGVGPGSVARIVAAQDAVTALVEELRVETERRMVLERVLGRAQVDEEGRVVPPVTPLTSSSAVKTSVSAEEALPEVTKVDVATSPICPCPSPEPPPADPKTTSPPPEQIPATVSILHQPTPRSTVGSPAFLSPRSSPSSSPVSIPQNTDSTLPPSLPPQDTTLACITNESDTTRSPSPLTRHSSLVAELGKTKTRYDELQRGFRDCHLALRDLSQTLQALSPSSSSPPSSLPISALQTILARLDDFNEDARVELEIRIADEERIARGYATLLAVPGAIASEAEAQEVERAVCAFVEGTGDATVARAQSRFVRKRDDLEHDVAALKRAVHELSHVHVQAPSSPSPSSSSSRPATPASWTSLAAGLFASASGAGSGSGGGSGGGTGSSSRPASPATTFGAVVTSPRTRRAASASGEANPLAALQQQLRIPMPELHHHHHHQVAPLPSSPVRAGSRARTSSGMYMLGLGMHGNVVGAGESRKVSVVGLAQRSTGLATDAQGGGDFEVE